MPTSTTNIALNKPLVNNPTDADLWGGYLNTNMDILDSQAALATVARVQDTSETAYNAGNISGAVSLDYTNGQYQYATLTGNVSSLTINNFPASGSGGWMTLELIQDGTGSRTLTLSSAYKKAGDAILLSTTASARDKLYLQTRDAGTTIDVTPTYNWS
jgi:hypothetical protein